MSEFPWRRAARRAAQLAPAGPSGTRAELAAVVESLRRAAATAPELVGEITDLTAAARAAAANPVFVIDRARWGEANARTFGAVVTASDVEGAQTGRLAAEETGLLLAALSTRVLGQFDPYVGEPRLLLVAPNILRLERELDLDAWDFRLWVALHEQTHALQFAAAPWLADHLWGRITGITGSIAAVEEEGRLAALVRAVRDLVTGRAGTVDLLGSLLDEEQARGLDEMIAVMSLLEGHADVVMDAVGPARLPSVRRIRAQFEKRRDGVGPADLFVRRITGMTDKVSQYRNGAAFVRGVVDRLGHDGLNAVWSAPENLPLPDEIADPELWVARVHG